MTPPDRLGPKDPPAVPRLSASLVVINHRNEVLLVQRNPQARSFAGAHVFPGGNYDAKQDTSLAMTAIRETFEESGLLIATNDSSIDLDNASLDQSRRAIHRQKTDFHTFLRNHSLKPDLASLHPFTTWVTPPISSRRFRTQFYVTFLPNFVPTGFSSGHREERLPTPDGGLEVIAARFIRPEDAVAEFRARHINLMPPQYYILETLRQLLPEHTSTPEQRERIALLSRGPFGQLVINPKSHRDPSSHKEFFVYEGDELRGGPTGRLHRAAVTRKGTVFAEIELQRNFDIFTEDMSCSCDSKL
ncbi:hypothetical protein PAXRUDRAFT_824271 [Paxillus rubicundulus Ve08.2h10]|uniref:Nudix hydrolase domain-containing protein n=1 Tax=Paxillus rubicundulus Ve08.2h10 TaxID=930991 RepID=A0A0D0E293_9AGAM|nr:hypothetical protein PAXRUDRAFT_824271 [Paxillus rubicundulus Ve08.2h10]